MDWPTPATLPALDSGEVHVWRIDVALGEADAQGLDTVLNREERERAARFRREGDRLRWTAARGAVRMLLGCYIGLPPDSLAFATGPHGKPRLAGPTMTHGGFRFNVSRSRDLALCAVARYREVGVDVEAIQPDFATDDIARRFFAPAERVALAALTAEARVAAFFACWTRKEAVLKARGSGLALGLGHFEVSVALDGPATVLAIHDDPAEAARWHLRGLDPGPGYAGALAVEGAAPVVSCWSWPGGLPLPPAAPADR